MYVDWFLLAALITCSCCLCVCLHFMLRVTSSVFFSPLNECFVSALYRLSLPLWHAFNIYSRRSVNLTFCQLLAFTILYINYANVVNIFKVMSNKNATRHVFLYGNVHLIFPYCAMLPQRSLVRYR